MFRIKRFFLVFFAAALSVFAACSSDDDPIIDPAHLPDKQWVFTELKIESFFNDTDVYADFEDCEKDNFYEFRDGGVLIIDEGPTKCAEEDLQQKTGTWSVQGNVMTISGLDLGLPSSTLELHITEASSTTLSGTFKGDYQGIPIDGYLTLKVK